MVIPLVTVMSDVGRSTRSENGETAGIIEASGVCGSVLDLEAGDEKISANIFQVTRWVIYLGAVERGTIAVDIDDGEGVLGGGAQDPTRSFRDSSPVLMTVVMTFKFCTPSTSTLEVEALMVKLGAALAAKAEVMRTTRVARRGESIAMWAVKAAGKTTVRNLRP